MAKPAVIEDNQINHMLKATAGYSKFAERDVALLLVLYGTGLNITELATITISDYITAQGKVKIESSVRPLISHNGDERPLFWSNKRVSNALDLYLAWRLENKHGATVKKSVYRGLDPDSPLFLTDDGSRYALTQKKLKSGLLNQSCNTLGKLITRLHSHAGIEGASAQSARRTLAVKLGRKGYDLVHIAAILGHKSIATTKRMVSNDPVRLADIVANAV